LLGGSRRPVACQPLIAPDSIPARLPLLLHRRLPEIRCPVSGRGSEPLPQAALGCQAVAAAAATRACGAAKRRLRCRCLPPCWPVIKP
jgi:hypothetical protein